MERACPSQGSQSFGGLTSGWTIHPHPFSLSILYVYLSLLLSPPLCFQITFRLHTEAAHCSENYVKTCILDTCNSSPSVSIHCPLHTINHLAVTFVSSTVYLGSHWHLGAHTPQITVDLHCLLPIIWEDFHPSSPCSGTDCILAREFSECTWPHCLEPCAAQLRPTSHPKVRCHPHPDHTCL